MATLQTNCETCQLDHVDQVTTSTNCGPCQIDQIIKQAKVWCVNCSEGLCEQCMEFHRRMKNSRMHKTVDVSAYDMNKSEISNMSLQCEYHGQMLDLFCPNHLLPCCMKCISNDHSKCNGIISLQSAVGGGNMYSACEDSHNNVDTTLHKLQQIIENRKSNLERIQIQKSNIKSILSDFKDDIIRHCEALESDVVSEITKFETSHVHNIESLVTDLENRKQNVQQMQAKQTAIKACTSPALAFVENLRIQRDIARQNENISNVLQGDAMSEFDLEFEPKIVLSTIFSGIDKLVDLKITTNKSTELFEMRDTNIDSFAQTASGSLSNMSNVHVKKKKELDVPVSAYLFGRRVSNIGNITNGHVIVCDYNSEVLCIDQDLGTSEDIDISGNPWDIVPVDDNTIAISYPQENAIKIIDTDTFQLTETLFLEGKGRGLNFTGKSLVVGINGREIQFLDLAGSKVSSFGVDDRGTVGLSYIHFDNNCVYCSEYKRNAVQCYDTSGGLVWEYEDSCLKSPRGICSDQYGNIYVVGLESNNIVFINRNGKFGQEVYDLADDVKKPKSISYDKNNNCLYVTNEPGDSISVYQVYYKTNVYDTSVEKRFY